jgi:hypothetical protein
MFTSPDPSDMRAIQVATVFAGVEMIKADLEDKESLKVPHLPLPPPLSSSPFP